MAYPNCSGAGRGRPHTLLTTLMVRARNDGIEGLNASRKQRCLLRGQASPLHRRLPPDGHVLPVAADHEELPLRDHTCPLRRMIALRNVSRFLTRGF